jgi:hypothetical protein
LPYNFVVVRRRLHIGKFHVYLLFLNLQTECARAHIART